MSKLSNEIQDAIKKNMPNMVATELQEFIARAEKNNIEVKSAKITIDKLNEDIKIKDKTIKNLEALKHSSTILDAKEEMLKDQERNLKVILAEAKTKAAESAKADIYTLVHGLFRNTEYKKQIAESTPVMTQPYDYQGKPNGSAYPQNVYTNKETTEEAK